MKNLPTPELWLYLHFCSLQLDSLYANTSQPLVILDKASNRIIQLNQTALDCGIQSGMGLGTAASLNHGLQVVEYQQHEEGHKLKDIATWLYGCTSDIALWPPDGLLLRIHPMLSLYGGLAPYWQAVKQRLQPLALSYAYACASTPLAARMLARCDHQFISQDPDKQLRAIRACPISATDLRVTQQQQLNRIGIALVGDLIAISPVQLSKRFDHELATYVGRLTGRFNHPQQFYYPSPRFKQSLELLYGIENSQRLLPPVNKLLAELEQFLRLRDKRTTELKFSFIATHTASAELVIVSAEAEYQARHWQALVALKLEQLKLPEPVHSIVLTVTELLDNPGQCNDLFAGKQGRHTPLQLLSLLGTKLGKNALKGLRLQDDVRPDHSSEYSEPCCNSAPGGDWTLPSLRPLLLCDPPAPLNEQVRLLQGPERLQTGWWDHQPVHRDYFIARSHQGVWLWVYRTPEAQWFVQGLFS